MITSKLKLLRFCIKLIISFLTPVLSMDFPPPYPPTDPPRDILCFSKTNYNSPKILSNCSLMLPECSKNTLKMLTICYKLAPKIISKLSRYAFKILPNCYKNASKMLLICSCYAPIMLPKSSQRAPKMLSKCSQNLYLALPLLFLSCNMGVGKPVLTAILKQDLDLPW